MRPPMVLMLTGMLLGTPAARGECGCLCADGRWQTLCTSPQESAAAGDRCLAGGSRPACPMPPEEAPEHYPAPVDGVSNCRRLRVYDAARDTFIGARACDLQPAD